MLHHNIINELRLLLEQEKEKLISELKEIAKPDPAIKGKWNAKFPQFEEKESGSSGSLETEEDEVEEYEVLLEAEHSMESRLLEVMKALERIQNGRYGTCAKCKQEIPLERLRANPAAECDREHQR